MGGKTRPAYPAEFRQQIVELYATGRRIVDLAKAFGCSEQSVASWVKRAGRLAALPDKGAAVLRTPKQARALGQASALSAQERTELDRELRDETDPPFDPRWWRVGKKRVARLMRQARLRGISRGQGFTVTTEGDEKAQAAPDWVKRQFVAPGPDELWVSEITYVPTWAGFIYLAIVLDAWSRKIVGWSIGEDLRTERVIAALNMALAQRKAEAVIHHSDQGSQYTSLAFGQRCEQMGVKPSMGTVGDGYDNAMAESFFATLECELIDRRVFKRKAEARTALFAYIEGWYNPRRRHGSIGYLAPAEFERCPVTIKAADLLHLAVEQTSPAGA